MTSEIHRVKNAISPIFCTKTTEWCVKGKNPLGLIPYKDGFSYDDNVCWQGVEERFLFYYFQDWVVYVEFRVYFLQAASVDTIYIRGRCPRLLMVVPSRHRSACGYGCWRRPIRGRTEISRGQVFILVYRLAMDARTWRGDGVAGWKYPSSLEDFQTDTASMARKRHLASSARGFYCFCLMSHWRNRG